MGPPLGHVRDPHKQSRFVEAELSALLQAAGGTMPVIKKDERGVYVMVEPASGHGATAAKPAAGKPAAAAPQPPATGDAKTSAAPKTVAAAPKPDGPKAAAEPNRQLFKRSTYAGVADTGPVSGETFEQKVARLKAVAAGAKQRAEEGGGEVAPSAEKSADSVAAAPDAQRASPPAPVAAAEPSASTPAVEAVAPSATPQAAAHKPTGNADRTLMRRSTYSGVVDTGPVAGESFEQKVERLRAVAAAAKQRSEQGES